MLRNFLLFIVLLAVPGIVSAQTEPKQDSSKTDTTQKETSLKEVSVTVQKKVIETAPGKTIINVQAMAGNAGKNLLDLLRKLPGISVDAQGNISMAGKQGVLITIDGRQTYLEGEDLRNYLQGITADDIAQVELVTQPSAHYDAEGNSGIINIKMRKIKKKGFNGSATTNYSYSKLYGSNSTILLNYRVNKVNLYSSINYINASSTVDWKNDFKFNDVTGSTIATSTMHSAPVEVFQKWNVRTGADYTYSANTTMGIGLTGAYYGNTMHSLINTINSSAGSTTNMERNTDESSLRRNAGVNLYLKHTFGEQAELNINLDYLLFTRIMSQYLTTAAIKDGISLADQLTLRSQLPINIQIWSAKADYTRSLKSGMKLEGGAKMSYVAVDNSGLFDTYNNGAWAYDASRTNHFIYKEQIAALYVNTTRKIGQSGKWEGQVGLRGEVANLRGLQQTTGEEFTRQLPAIFPTAYLNYKPDSNNSFEMNYGRRVERPHYSMLNPFNYYTFYNTYQRGNPTLLPQYSHNVELKHMYKSKLTTGLELSSVSNNISNIAVPQSNTQTTYGMPINFGTTKMAALSVGYNNKLLRWWDFMITVQAGYVTYSGLIQNVPVTNNGGFASVWMNNQFTYNKWTFDSWFSYTGAAPASPVEKNLQNVFMNFGAARKLYHDKLNIRLGVDDPFNIYRTKAESIQPGLYSATNLKPNSQIVNLTLTYNFGSNSEFRSRNNNGPDEAKRM